MAQQTQDGRHHRTSVALRGGLQRLVEDTRHTYLHRLQIGDRPLQHQGQHDNGKTNIFVAAFTTCLARPKLYESLEKLGEQVLYFDTDSVIYRLRPGQPEIPLGDFLGNMTNELDDGDHITEFVSGGPKNYGYTTAQGKVC